MAEVAERSSKILGDFVQRHADFGIALEAADPGAVARARIDDDDWAGLLVDASMLSPANHALRHDGRPAGFA